MNSSVKIDKIEINKIVLKDIFKNLKCDYFLQKLFNNLLKKKSLEIIKYNKNMKEKINISIEDYKEYSNIYSSIEIELKPAKNKYGEFININKENEKYCHIYFNNKKTEIKRNYLKQNEKISKIKIIIDYHIKSFEYLFESCKCLECINFKKFYRNNITNMGCMYSGCSSLNELNLSNFNTNNVTNMRGMFQFCSSLNELNLSNFNTNNVTDMGYMFQCCSSLKKLNLSNFNFNNVTYMALMFYGCSSLNELNLSKFNINNSTTITSMFCRCSQQFKNKIRAKYKNIKNDAFIDSLKKGKSVNI